MAEGWLPARDALTLVAPAFENESAAMDAIVQRASSGLITARCGLKRIISDSGRRPEIRETNCYVPAFLWEAIRTNAGQWRVDWSAGDFSTKRYAEMSGTTETLVFSVEFLEADLRRIAGVRRSNAERHATNLEGWGKLAAAIQPSLERGLETFTRLQEENVPRVQINVPSPPELVVSVGEFNVWYDALTPEIQAWGGLRLRQKCSKDHDGRHVLKKATDHITKGRKTGRKRGSKNVPRN
jgi:hypothetical protein